MCPRPAAGNGASVLGLARHVKPGRLLAVLFCAFARMAARSHAAMILPTRGWL